MIARIWAGRTRAEHAEEYVEYVKKTGVTQQRATPGNQGSMILSRELGDEVEFMVFSLWESMDAVRAFAGESPEVAVYYPDDETFLLELEPEVRHYQVPVIELA
jgi:heme-degrading monooxygenase HmoA